MMAEGRNRFVATFSFLGGIGGLISLATIVFYGGHLVATVNTLNARVTTLENAGPATVQAHIAMDEVRYQDHERRMENMERMLPSMDKKLDRLLTRP